MTSYRNKMVTAAQSLIKRQHEACDGIKQHADWVEQWIRTSAWLGDRRRVGVTIAKILDAHAKQAKADDKPVDHTLMLKLLACGIQAATATAQNDRNAMITTYQDFVKLMGEEQTINDGVHNAVTPHVHRNIPSRIGSKLTLVTGAGMAVSGVLSAYIHMDAANKAERIVDHVHDVQKITENDLQAGNPQDDQLWNAVRAELQAQARDIKQLRADHLWNVWQNLLIAWAGMGAMVADSIPKSTWRETKRAANAKADINNRHFNTHVEQLCDLITSNDYGLNSGQRDALCKAVVELLEQHLGVDHLLITTDTIYQYQSQLQSAIAKTYSENSENRVAKLLKKACAKMADSKPLEMYTAMQNPFPSYSSETPAVDSTTKENMKLIVNVALSGLDRLIKIHHGMDQLQATAEAGVGSQLLDVFAPIHPVGPEYDGRSLG